MLTVNFRYLPLRPGDLVLDVGCGEGRHTIGAVCHSAVTVVGVDINKNNLECASQKLAETKIKDGSAARFVTSDAKLLPFVDDSFDAVICSEVLEHIMDYRTVLPEIARVLRSGGALCASVPRCWPEKICWALSREYHETPGGHVHIFRTRELKDEIEYCGFKHYRRHWAHALHVPFWWLKCIFWRSQQTNWLVSSYHKLLIWDLMRKPLVTRFLEFLLNPIMGKSVVLYFRKDTSV